MHDGVRPSPFLKWAGGKRQLLPRLLELVPARIDTYCEPFLGGAALFFALAALRRFKRAVLADANGELMICYQAVRDDVGGVVAALQTPRYRNNSDCYYRARAVDPEGLAPTERAARLIYLNRCGFNGLFRVNSRGRFNVPFGRYKRPTICDEDKLRAASAVLQGVDIACADFAGGFDKLKPRDFVYLDPPYAPLSKTSSFTAYAARDFGVEDQRRLAAVVRRLARRRVPALLSNSDCALTRELYDGLPIERVAARRSINSVAGGRGPVDEILVRNFAYPVPLASG